MIPSYTSLVSCGFHKSIQPEWSAASAPRRYRSGTALQQLPPGAPVSRRQGKADDVKTIAIRLEDETSELLSLVAQLEGTSQIDQIREAIASHLERKVAEGDLTARAQEALDEVEREADSKRKAIEQLVSNVADNVRQIEPTGRRRSSKTVSDEEKGEQ
jgi:predicted DNA-binding protein